VRKIPTLFVRDPDDMSRVLPEYHPACGWVRDGEGVATRKYDGTCVMLDPDGIWWARREVKPGKRAPQGYVAVEVDLATGKTMGWESIEQSAFAKFLPEAIATTHMDWAPGTYELLGPKINGNPEIHKHHVLQSHAKAQLLPDAPRTFEGLALYLDVLPYEGIVWHHPDGRKAKIKRRDFGHRWGGVR